jgi:FemAB-related protein (PEP-CTERM system-associated)
MNIADAARLAPSVTVRRYRDTDRQQWCDFVARCPQATFFHRIEWRDLLERVFRHRTHYLLAHRAGRLVGVLPLAEVKSVLFGHALVSLPFAERAGVACAEADALPPLHEAARALAQSLGVRHLELRNAERREPGWPRQDLYVSFRRSISADDDENLRAIPRKQRAMVRKAMQRGLKSEVDSDVGRFYELYADNVHRHGTPALPRRWFEQLQRAFGADCEVLTVVDAGARPVSSVLSFYFRDEVLPYYAGDVPAARELAANDFKYWELMRRAAARGARVFDFGRSKRDTGPYDFKRNWGFTPVALQYEYALLRRASVPQNHPANPRFRTSIALWKRLPRPVAGWLGPRIVRSLG